MGNYSLISGGKSDYETTKGKRNSILSSYTIDPGKVITDGYCGWKESIKVLAKKAKEKGSHFLIFILPSFADPNWFSMNFFFF